MDDANNSSKRKPLKIARNVFIHNDEIEIDSVNVLGSFRVENGIIHSVILDNETKGLEGRLVGKEFKGLVK
jgi:hypothetical protein